MVVPIAIVLTFAFVALAIGGWLLAHLIRQQAEFDRRLARLERSPGTRTGSARPPHPGLLAGSVLNDFELPNLAGGRTALSRWYGRRVALIFVHPDCRHSRRLIPLLVGRRMPVDDGALLPVFISTGDVAANRVLFGHTPPSVPILLQEDREVAHLLRVTATPAAYLVDRNRVTETPLIFGVRAILDALGIAEHGDDGSGAETTRLPMEWSEVLRPPAVGTAFPSLTLPGLHGSTIVLGPNLTRRTLVVLIDPDCPRCRELAPRIANCLNARSDAFDILVIGQGDDDATRSYVDAFGLAVPVALQRRRDASRVVGTLETPVALVLDPGGIVASPVAIGVEAVLSHLGSGGTGGPETRVGDEPLVSVVLTTRDRPGFLPFALTCYDRQTYSRRELIVVDDGDQSPVDPRLVEAVGGRLVRAAPGTPIGAKLNLGLETARGVLCQKMDDDDWYAPAYVESMVAAILENWRTACRPAIAFVTPFLFFDVARWEIRRSLDRNVPGATLFFRRADWIERPFRPLPGDEDLWFYLDQIRAGATPVVVDQPELFLAVRHRGALSERGHTWVNQSDNRPLEDYIAERPLHVRTPEQILPPWALGFYQKLRTDLTADAAAAR